VNNAGHRIAAIYKQLRSASEAKMLESIAILGHDVTILMTKAPRL
jgi:hypothetical protein